MSAKSDKKYFIQKERKNKTTMAHDCQTRYLVARLYI